MQEQQARRVIAHARGWIGTPYQHQASLKGVGCDCLGLVRGVWREIYGDEPEGIPPYSPDWAEAGKTDALLAAAERHFLASDGSAKPQTGALLLFRWRKEALTKHVGILTTGDHFIHAHDGACVSEVAFSPWWQRHLAAHFLFPHPQ